MTLTLFNLFSENQQGYGGRLSGYVPFADSAFALEPSVGARIAQFEENPDDSLFVDAAVNIHWQLSRDWFLNSGGNYSYSDEVQRVSFTFNLGFRW